MKSSSVASHPMGLPKQMSQEMKQRSSRPLQMAYPCPHVQEYQEEQREFPYGFFATRIFQHFNIEIPAKLKVKSLPLMTVGEKMMSKMGLRFIEKRWKNR